MNSESYMRTNLEDLDSFGKAAGLEPGQIHEGADIVETLPNLESEISVRADKVAEALFNVGEKEV